MKLRLTLLIAAATLLGAASSSAKQMFAPRPVGSVSELADRLDSLKKFECRAAFTVSMPSMADDVVYDLHLIQQAADSDRLSTRPYLIEWTMTEPQRGPEGFSAYYDGNHFRFSGRRLQEFHLPADSAALCPPLSTHRSVQFFNLLPQGIAAELRAMAADSTWHMELRRDTIAGGRRSVAVSALRSVGGELATRAEYIFDPSTALPRRIAIDSNPGAIGEQSVYVDFTDCPYLDLDPEALPFTISEQWLAERFPRQFATMRQATFVIANLPGQPLPGFALPTSTGERYARRAGDALRAPTFVALLSADSPDVGSLIATLRQAAAEGSADIIWAFADRNVDSVEPPVGQLLPGEHLLISAQPLIRDCGATTLPAIILADREGNVVKVITDCNKAALSDVIQKMK
ncbi:MAG: hypothetical protein K2G08_03760 [Paramuribaculum sp.]|nr:hypothetical protein [Paramuribaculum sp.]